MNFDHLTDQQREQLKRDVLRLNKADVNAKVHDPHVQPYIPWTYKIECRSCGLKFEKEVASYGPNIPAFFVPKYCGDCDSKVTFEQAKEQVLKNDLISAARARDEYKMQLEAANKHIEILMRQRNITDEDREYLLSFSADAIASLTLVQNYDIKKVARIIENLLGDNES